MDVILDSKLKPYLLEVNHTPSFSTDTPLDKTIKKGLIRDTLLLMDINPINKQRIKALLK
jgi:tubulin polyglutamylase TTLL6/13